MNPGRKVIAACLILLAGITVALLFRHGRPRSGLTSLEGSQQLVLKRQAKATLPLGSPSRRQAEFPPGPDHRAASGRPAAARATVLRPSSPNAPPPALARRYPGPPDAILPPWGARIELPAPGLDSADDRPQVHKIVDGDTLPRLAEEYLGSADRYLEIYEANREILQGPELLPIGVELRIPPRRPIPSASRQTLRKRPLVPIHHEGDR